jgi:hypothetical protein
MQLDEKTLQELTRLEPRKAYESVRSAVLQNPWGASSEDMQDAMRQLVEAGILTWEQIDRFEEP